LDDHHLLENVLCYLLATVIAVPIFRRVGLGSILGYLAAGALIGPAALNFVSDPTDALHFAEFGVIMLLFVIGLELAPDKLWRMRSQILMLGGGQLFVSAILLFVLCYFLVGIGGQIAVILGLTLALSSTAFALQLMAERGILASPLGRKGFSILLLQDIAVIPILILVQVWAGAGSNEQTSVVNALISIGSIAGLLVASRYLLNPALRLVAEYGSREVMTAAALLIVLGTAVLVERVGLSMGLGAFTAGIMLANSSFRHQLQTDIEPFKGLLLGLFFIAVGMTLDLRLLLSEPLLIFGGALILMFLKTLVISVLVRLTGQGWREGISLGLILSQGGEFAFVVLSQSLSLGFVDAALVNQVVLTVGLSMALTSPFVVIWSRLSKSKEQEGGEYDKTRDDSEPEVIIAGFGRFGQIIGRMLAANHIPFTALDKSSSHVDFVRRFGNKIFYGDGSRMDVLEAAGIQHAQLLVVCVNSEDSLAIIETAKEMYPELRIVARAINRNHAYQLHALGVDHVFREYFASGLEAARVTLTTLGFTDAQAIDKVDVFRKHDEKLLQQAVEYKEDQEKLLEIAQEGRKELESLFTQDEKI
jgi:monovalent cation:proton antiporter-2 (CPA2) family protein